MDGQRQSERLCLTDCLNLFIVPAAEVSDSGLLKLVSDVFGWSQTTRLWAAKYRSKHPAFLVMSIFLSSYGRRCCVRLWAVQGFGHTRMTKPFESYAAPASVCCLFFSVYFYFHEALCIPTLAARASLGMFEAEADDEVAKCIS
jgi:hypothetical protein